MNRKTTKIAATLFYLSVFLFAGAAGPVSSFAAEKIYYTEEAVAGGGSIKGVVRLEGTLPPPTEVNLHEGKNSEFCLENAKANKEGILALYPVQENKGNVQDVVVFIENISKGKPWAKEPLIIDFKNCEAFPKIGVVRKPRKFEELGLLVIKNHDEGVLHNPKGYSIGEDHKKILFKKFLLNKGAHVDVTRPLKYFQMDRDSHFYVECEQHLWMTVSTRVIWNPYYSISKGNGSFKIDQIPPGKYKVTAWHPYLGEKTLEVDIAGGEEKEIGISFP